MGNSDFYCSQLKNLYVKRANNIYPKIYFYLNIKTAFISVKLTKKKTRQSSEQKYMIGNTAKTILALLNVAYLKIN